MPHAYLSHLGQVLNGEAAEATYTIRECQDLSQAVQLAHGEAPVTMFGLPKNAIPSGARFLGFDTCEVSFTYATEESQGGGGGLPEPPSETEPSLPVLNIDINSSASVRVREAIAQSHVPEDAPNMKKAIGVTYNTGAGFQVEGADQRVPAFSFSLSVQWPAQALAAAGGGQYLFNLYRNTTKRNASPWTARAFFQDTILELPFDQKEVQFLGAVGGGSGRFFTLDYHFLADGNDEIDVAEGIPKLQKYGHEYVWFLYNMEESQNRLVSRPAAAYAAVIYRDTDFQTLLGF